MARAAVADDVGRGLAHGPGQDGLDVGRQRDLRAVDRRLDARRVERRPRALELGVERGPVVAADRLAHLAQRVARDGLDVGHVGRRGLGVVGQAPLRELRLERDDRQRVAEQVVQVAREALALVGHRQARHLGARLDQLAVGAHDLAHRHHRRADAEQAEGLAPGGVRVAAADGRGHAGDDGRDRQHDDVPRPRQAQGAHGDHVEEEQVPVGAVGDRQRGGDGQVDDVGARDDRRRLGIHPPAHRVEEQREEDDERGGDGDEPAGAGLVAQQPDDGGQRDEDREDARDSRRGHPQPIRGQAALSAPSPGARSASPAASR